MAQIRNYHELLNQSIASAGVVVATSNGLRDDGKDYSIVVTMNVADSLLMEVSMDGANIFHAYATYTANGAYLIQGTWTHFRVTKTGTNGNALVHAAL